jgi:hypothetical protein
MGKNKKGEIIDASDAIADIKKVILATHKVKQTKDHYDYKGVDVTESCITASCPTIKSRLTKESVKYNHEEQGRDMLEMLLYGVFQLGFQNGYLEKNVHCEMLKGNIKSLSECIEWYKKELEKHKK